MSSAPRPSAVYLHSGFRSGSTWFWNRFRKAAGSYAYYEPFNEALAGLDAAWLAADRADCWPSGHPVLDAPYYAEYAPLIAPGGGVPGYRRRFAYQSYFDGDAEQAAYLATLTEHAQDRGSLPVFGFCRSLARLPGLKIRCPGLHLVTWRNPWDQWSSYHDQMVRLGNGYFEFRAFLIASLGRCDLRYQVFFSDLHLPPMLACTTGDDEPFLGHFFWASDAGHRFRVFLRVFLVEMLTALPQADLLVDLDRMSAEPSYRTAMTAALQRATGLDDLSFDDCALPRHGGLSDGAYLAAFDEALGLLDDWGRRPLPLPIDAAALAFVKERILACRADLARLAAIDPPPELPSIAPDRYALCHVLFAILRMQRAGASAIDGRAYLRAVYGGDFPAMRDDLAGLAGLVDYMDGGPEHARRKQAALELRELLAGGVEPEKASAGQENPS